MPLRVEGRAALYSFGFLLRRAAAVRLDIHERELNVGLKSRRTLMDRSSARSSCPIASRTAQGIALISVYHRNREPATVCPGAPKQLVLRSACGPNRSSWTSRARPFLPDIVPRLSRDFSNLTYHNILDWRLGLDLARLALDVTAAIDFSVPYWHGLDAAAAAPYFAASPGWQPTSIAGLQAGRRGNVVEIITHPLWNTDPN